MYELNWLSKLLWFGIRFLLFFIVVFFFIMFSRRSLKTEVKNIVMFKNVFCYVVLGYFMIENKVVYVFV